VAGGSNKAPLDLFREVGGSDPVAAGTAGAVSPVNWTQDGVSKPRRPKMAT
jgi:hypothetical protein